MNISFNTLRTALICAYEFLRNMQNHKCITCHMPHATLILFTICHKLVEWKCRQKENFVRKGLLTLEPTDDGAVTLSSHHSSCVHNYLNLQINKYELVYARFPFSMMMLLIGFPATGYLRKEVLPETAIIFGIMCTYGIPEREEEIIWMSNLAGV